MRAGKRPDRGPNRMRTDSAMLYMRADSSRGAPMASAMTGETGSYTYMAPEVGRRAWGLPACAFDFDRTCWSGSWPTACPVKDSSFGHAVSMQSTALL